MATRSISMHHSRFSQGRRAMLTAFALTDRYRIDDAWHTAGTHWAHGVTVDELRKVPAFGAMFSPGDTVEVYSYGNKLLGRFTVSGVQMFTPADAMPEEWFDLGHPDLISFRVNEPLYGNIRRGWLLRNDHIEVAK